MGDLGRQEFMAPVLKATERKNSVSSEALSGGKWGIFIMRNMCRFKGMSGRASENEVTAETRNIL